MFDKVAKVTTPMFSCECNSTFSSFLYSVSSGVHCDLLELLRNAAHPIMKHLRKPLSSRQKVISIINILVSATPF